MYNLLFLLPYRTLSKLCMRELVCEGNQISTFESDTIPADLYPMLLSEAIFQRQLHSIDFLVSTWPNAILDIQSVMPKEDLVEPLLLTIPIEGHEGITFLDCIMYGLLRQNDSSRLRTVNLSGFKQGTPNLYQNIEHVENKQEMKKNLNSKISSKCKYSNMN